MSLEECGRARMPQRADARIPHRGRLHPKLPLSYYTNHPQAARAYPGVHVKR